MKEKNSYDVWVAIGTIASWVCILSFLILIIGAFCNKYLIAEVPNMEGFWDVVLNSVLPAAITGLVTVIVSYFVFLKKMPDRIAKELDKKMDPSNAALHEEQLAMLDKVNPSNKALRDAQRDDRKQLQDEHKELKAEHEKLRGYLEAAALRAAREDGRYEKLSADQRTIVDAVQKLDGFAGKLQQLQEENVQLREEIQILREKYEYERSRTVDRDRDDRDRDDRNRGTISYDR